MNLVNLTEYAKINGVSSDAIRSAVLRGKVKVIERKGVCAYVDADIPYSDLATPKRPYGKQPRLSNILRCMKQRCYNKQNARYPIYGGRGITICEEWRNDTNAFIKWALENGYAPGLTIDRIDNDKGYCPENCQWITGGENSAKRHQDNAPKAIAKAEEFCEKYLSGEDDKKWAEKYMKSVKKYWS